MDILGRCNSPSDISGDDHDFEHTDMILIFDEDSDKNAECMKREDLLHMYDISEVNVWQIDPRIKLVKLPYLGVWVMGIDEISRDRVVFTLEKAVPTEEMKDITRRILYNSHRDQGMSPEEAKIFSPQEEKEINQKIAIGSNFGVSRLHGALEIVRKIVLADDRLDWVQDIEERSRSRIVEERKESEFIRAEAHDERPAWRHIPDRPAWAEAHDERPAWRHIPDSRPPEHRSREYRLPEYRPPEHRSREYRSPGIRFRPPPSSN